VHAVRHAESQPAPLALLLISSTRPGQSRHTTAIEPRSPAACAASPAPDDPSDDPSDDEHDHFKKGNLQAACDVISLAHYPIGQADHSRDYIVKMFEKRGIRAGQGR
jgi:hypothetical protein